MTGLDDLAVCDVTSAWPEAAPLLSILVPTYDHDVVPLCRELLADMSALPSGRVELLVLIDGNPQLADQSQLLELAEQHGLPACLARASANLGRSGARNRLARLARGRGVPVRLPRLVQDDGGYRLEAPDGGFTLAVCWDYLQHVPPLQAALSEIRRTLAPGGRFVFSLPFHYRASHTVSHLGHIPRRGGRLPAEFRGEIHDIGWDILAMLTDAGFSDSRAHHYWSDELGYLGAFNLVFSASC